MSNTPDSAAARARTAEEVEAVMPADTPDRDRRVELVAAALCEEDLSLPGGWALATEDRRDRHRRDAHDLLTNLDKWIAVEAALAAVLDVEAGLSPIVPTRYGQLGGWPA